ncbi:hypothetical protein Tco_0086512 [Tanacetum coccineum]
MYYQVFRGDGSSKNYKVLSEMLEDFDRLDVEELYRLVKNRYSASSPEGFDLMLWGDLHTLFEPDKDDEIWRDQHEYNLLSWRLCDFCGIHILLIDNGLAIHMLTEKKYPLSQEMLTKMLSRKLEVDHESSQALVLLRFIRSQVKKWRNPYFFSRNATRVLCNPTSAFRSVDASSDGMNYFPDQRLYCFTFGPDIAAKRFWMYLNLSSFLYGLYCFPEIANVNPAAVVTVKPTTKQTVKNIANEVVAKELEAKKVSLLDFEN